MASSAFEEFKQSLKTHLETYGWEATEKLFVEELGFTLAEEQVTDEFTKRIYLKANGGAKAVFTYGKVEEEPVSIDYQVEVRPKKCKRCGQFDAVLGGYCNTCISEDEVLVQCGECGRWYEPPDPFRGSRFCSNCIEEEERRREANDA